MLKPLNPSPTLRSRMLVVRDVLHDPSGFKVPKTLRGIEPSFRLPCVASPGPVPASGPCLLAGHQAQRGS